MNFKKIIFLFLLGIKPLLSAPQEEYPVVILGGGVAGLAAAIQVSQAGLQPLVITGPSPGGIITQSHSIRNWPGEIDISGQELADKFQKHAEASGVVFHSGHVTNIDVSKQPYVLTVENPLEKKVQTIKARTCIIALGALPRLLDVPGEKENLFKTIFTCAPCDGLRFKGKTVAIIGGGDSALTEAHYLSNLAKKVYLIVRRGQFKTIQPKYRDAILERPNIEVLYNTTVEAFDHHQQGLTLKLATEKGPKSLAADGAFLAIGSIPNTELFKGKLELDRDGYILLKNGQMTSVEGIYAVGDVADKTCKQAMSAAGDATKAALEAQKKIGLQSTPLQAELPKPLLKEIFSLNSLRESISSSQKPVVVYFYSHTCPPCRSFRSTYDKWAAEYQDKADFFKVNGEQAPDCFAAYQIKGIPTVLILDPKGKIIHQAVGLKELAELPSVLYRY